jgi:hypothetical protein
MNLQPINPPGRIGQRALCCACGKWRPLSQIRADLDGEAFKAYYCYQCKERRNGKADRREYPRSDNFRRLRLRWGSAVKERRAMWGPNADGRRKV